MASLMDRIENHAAVIGEMQRQVKLCGKVYQYEAKVTVADYYGLEFDEVNLPFTEWMELRRRYTRDTGLEL